MIAILLMLAAVDQAVPSGEWAVTSTVVDLKVPGLPGFLQRMARGRSKSERKRLAAGQGIEALLAPDPKAACHVDSQVVAGGRYAQALTCPQKKDGPLRVSRAGTYDATGFVGRASVAGATAKGPVNIVLDQRAVRVGG